MSKKKKLTTPQREVVKYLARGQFLYMDERGKYRITTKENLDKTDVERYHKIFPIPLEPEKIDMPLSGHSETRKDIIGGAHMFRPTIEALHDANLLKGEFDKNQRPRWRLNTKNKEYADDIKMLIVEGALGVTRRALASK